MIQNQIFYFPNKKDLNKIDEIDGVNEIAKLRSSKVFIEIYEYYLNQNVNNNKDSEILEKAKNYFLNIKQLFNPNTENNIDINFLEK